MQKQLNLVPTLLTKVTGSIGAMDINKRLNHLAISGFMKQIHIIELKNNQIIQQLDIPGNGAICLMYSKDDTLFVVGFQCLLVFEYSDGHYHHTQTIQDEIFNGPTILKNNQFLSIIGYNNLYIYDYLTKEKKIINVSNKSQMNVMAINKKEDLLLAGGYNGIYFFDLKNQRIKSKKTSLYVYKLQISNNSQLYIEEIYQSLKIKSFQSHKTLRQFISDNNQCSLCQRFTKNDSFLILSGLDWKIRVYNVKYGNLQIYQQNLGNLFIFQFQDDENIEFICGTNNGSVVKWSNK